MSRQRPLTRIAHELLTAHIQDGDRAIDATMGNGHDTLFLAEQVGESGQVQAFDIQTSAIEQTTAKLRDAGVAERVALHATGHQCMLQNVPDNWQGNTSAITFNLGYLPGGDKTITTLPESTLLALAHSSQLLAPGGKLSILAYRGHPGGQQETQQVLAWIETDPTLELKLYESPGPVLLMVSKKNQGSLLKR